MKKVLTVDDSKVVRRMVARHLQGYSCEVFEATNGQEAIAAALEHHPDLILLDVTMPVLDGRQALTELRRNPATAAIPVIMLTAESGREMVMDLARLRVQGYIVKPFQADTFDCEVQKVLGPPDPAAAAAPAPPRVDASAPLDREAALIVDDSERVLEAARAALEPSPRVLVAASGADAVARYREARPGAVVIDLVMPDMDGFTTATALRALGSSPHVALAVRGDAKLRERARLAGFLSVVEKPFQAAELREHVVGALQSLATPEELVGTLLGEEAGCCVLDFPDPRTRTFGRVTPLLGAKLRALAEAGNDKLIVDVGRIAEVNGAVVNLLAGLIMEARAIGIRTAICAPDAAVTESLRQIAEMRGTPCAASRAAARDLLS